jgi:hypothetical protein
LKLVIKILQRRGCRCLEYVDIYDMKLFEEQIVMITTGNKQGIVYIWVMS